MPVAGGYLSRTAPVGRATSASGVRPTPSQLPGRAQHFTGAQKGSATMRDTTATASSPVSSSQSHKATSLASST
eukprot:11180391-Lingulodinium_polyedra.AAC.1